LVLVIIAAMLSPERGGPMSIGSQVVVSLFLFVPVVCGLAMIVHQKLREKKEAKETKTRSKSRSAKGKGGGSSLQLSSPASSHQEPSPTDIGVELDEETSV
jgi:hypothetical protein